jgi:hypothetical protein
LVEGWFVAISGVDAVHINQPPTPSLILRPILHIRRDLGSFLGDGVGIEDIPLCLEFSDTDVLISL